MTRKHKEEYGAPRARTVAKEKDGVCVLTRSVLSSLSSIPHCRVPVLFLRGYAVVWFGGRFHYNLREDIGFEPVKIFCPLFVVVGAHRQACRAVIVLGKVGETAPGIYLVAVVPQVVLSGCGGAFVRDCVGGAELAAGFAVVAERGDTGVHRVVGLHRDGGDNAPHAEQRAKLRVDNGSVPAKLAESRFQSDGNVQQVAVPYRMLNGAGPAQTSDPLGEGNHRFPQRVVHAQALDGRLFGRNDLKLPPQHSLPHGDLRTPR